MAMNDYNISYSTELMQNYMQAEIVKPDAKFEALQTNTGHALLFSIGTDLGLYVTEETPGTSRGWKRSNMSKAQIAKDFAGIADVNCSDFSVAQAVDESIHMAMVISDAKNDHLYISLGNSASDTSWIDSPSWIAFPYDDAKHARSVLKIVRVFISEASDREYIVVDVLRNPESRDNLIFRYYIDVKKSAGYSWTPRDVAVDIEAENYQSCLGRKGGQHSFAVDGIYTNGLVAGNAQLVYSPLFNVFNPAVAPSPSNLHLPGNIAPDAIAACRNVDQTSDLYAVSAGKLYYFSSTNQRNGSFAVQVAESTMFTGVRTLFASSADSTSITVWGLNSSNQIFYTSCPRISLTNNPSVWSVPLPILTDVEQVSPYISLSYSANTFFAHTGGSQLTKATKSPETSMWNFQNILLPEPDATATAKMFSSYTTRISIVLENGEPAKGIPVWISANNVTSIFINHLYYIVGAVPVQVQTDTVGTITLVERVLTLAGTRLTISIGNKSTQINPMEKAVLKATSLTTVQDVRSAMIHYPDGRTKSLVAPGTDEETLHNIASSNEQLSKAYAKTAAAPSIAVASFQPLVTSRAVNRLSALPSILVDAGDLFSWIGQEIESGAKRVITFLEDSVTGFYVIIVNIAGKTFHALLDGIEKIAAGVEWVYNAVKTAMEDLLKFLEFLFEIPDMRRTKQVIKNLINVYLDHQVASILDVKSDFDNILTEAEKAIDDWGGIKDWSGLGADASMPVSSKSKPSANQTAPGSLLMHHYQENIKNATQISPSQVQEPPLNPIEVLFQAISHEAVAIGDAIQKLLELSENFVSMTLENALKELVAILGHLVVESAKTVIDTVFDVVYDLVKAAIEGLNATFHIPVVSDILSQYGLQEFSILDIICWVVAVPATLAFKAIYNRAPFPDNAETSFLINTKDYEKLVKVFSPTPPVAAVSARSLTAGPTTASVSRAVVSSEGPIALSQGVSRSVFVTGHCVSGFCALMGAIVSTFEAMEETGGNPFSIFSGVLGIIGGVSAAMADVLVPYDPIDNKVVAKVRTVTTGTRILCKVIFSGPAQKSFAKSSSITVNKLAVKDGRGVGAIVDATLVIPGLFTSIYHFVELSKKPVSSSRSIAIVDEVAIVTSFLNRITYTVAVNSEGDVKVAAVTLVAVTNVCLGGLQIGDSLIV